MGGRYVALLRGINVGGRNPLPMADLRAALDRAGFVDVATYIQSGNVVFSSDLARAAIGPAVEHTLQHDLGMAVPVVVRSRTELRSIVDGRPSGFGDQPDRFHSDVVFLKAPLGATDAVAAFDTRDGVDRIWPGDGVVYFERLSERRTQSRMSRVTARAEYRLMTIRNWATTLKLLGMLDAPTG